MQNKFKNNTRNQITGELRFHLSTSYASIPISKSKRINIQNRIIILPDRIFELALQFIGCFCSYNRRIVKQTDNYFGILRCNYTTITETFERTETFMNKRIFKQAIRNSLLIRFIIKRQRGIPIYAPLSIHARFLFINLSS